jgi:hypothetical protein
MRALEKSDLPLYKAPSLSPKHVQRRLLLGAILGLGIVLSQLWSLSQQLEQSWRPVNYNKYSESEGFLSQDEFITGLKQCYILQWNKNFHQRGQTTKKERKNPRFGLPIRKPSNTAQNSAPFLALVNATLWDGDGNEKDNAAVIVKEGVIQAICPMESFGNPDREKNPCSCLDSYDPINLVSQACPGLLVVNLHGRVLTPGLVDLHR